MHAYVCVTKTCIKMFIAAFFVIAPNWKPPTCPSSVEWINQLLCMYAMGYYTAMKMNQLLLATWMNLTNTMLAKEARHKRMQTV